MRRQYTFDTGNRTYHLDIETSYPYVISGGSPGRIKRIANFLEKKTIIESDRGLVTVYGTYKGVPITAFSTGMGPASVSITLPEVIEACDYDDMIIIRLGTGGGLQKNLNIGDFVITSDVERAESTSDKIMSPNYLAKSDLDIRLALKNSAEKNKKSYQNVFVGTTRVTDDIYFDAIASKNMDNKDVLAVSMEFSVYCALRDRYNMDQNRNIKVGELLVISDVIAHQKITNMKEFLKKQPEIEEAHIISGLETIYSLSRNKQAF